MPAEWLRPLGQQAVGAGANGVDVRQSRDEVVDVTGGQSKRTGGQLSA